MCTKVYPAVTQVLTTNLATSIFYPTTPWVPAISAYNAKSVVALVSPTASFRVASAYQTAATNPNTPDSPSTQLGTWVTSEGTTGDTWTDISSSLSTKFWVRFGVIIQDNSGAQGDTIRKGEVTCSIATKDHA